MYVYMCDVYMHMKKWAYMTGVESVHVWMLGWGCVYGLAQGIKLFPGGSQSWSISVPQAHSAPHPHRADRLPGSCDYAELFPAAGLPPRLLRILPAGAGVPPLHRSH